MARKGERGTKMKGGGTRNPIMGKSLTFLMTTKFKYLNFNFDHIK